MKDDNALHIEMLRPIHDRIVLSETDSITDRWKFGCALAELRVGKQLPKGLRANIKEQFGLEASEITRRMQLAERYETREEVVDACTTYGGSWRRIIREELVKKPRETMDLGWTERAESRVNRLVAEAAEPSRRDDLVKLLKRALTSLRQTGIEQEAA